MIKFEEKYSELMLEQVLRSPNKLARFLRPDSDTKAHAKYVVLLNLFIPNAYLPGLVSCFISVLNSINTSVLDSPSS